MAATHITADQLAVLEKLDDEMNQLVRPPSDENLDELAVLNGRFDEIVHGAANNPALRCSLRTSRLLPLVRRTSRHYDSARLRRWTSSHLELVEAFRNGNWAEATTQAHIWSAAVIQRYGARAEPRATLDRRLAAGCELGAEPWWLVRC